MKISSINGTLAWRILSFYIIENKSFTSITGIVYQAKLVSNGIEYIGDNRNEGLPERIDKKEFIAGFDLIKNIDPINTNTIKGILPNSLYRKRSPFIGLLNSAGILN
jgi:hypothetical protein